MRGFPSLLLRKIVLYAVNVFLSISIVFMIFRLMPGDPLGAFLVNMGQQYSWRMEGATELIKAYREEFGLDDDLWTQYTRFLRNLFLKLDFGPSFLEFPKRSQELILRALPYTLSLLGFSAITSWLIGNLIGTLIGWKRDTKVDRILFSIALGLSQIPYYFLAIFLVLFLAYIIPLFPSSGAWAATVKPELSLTFIASYLRHVTLPSLSVIIVSLSGWLISMRALTITVLGEDYLLFAQAKGLRKRRLLLRYVMRNTLLPQVTGLAMAIGFITSGFLLVETVFLYPGMGSLLVRALNYMDYNTALGCVTITIITVLTANLIIELLYPLVDPRIRTE
ncbi:MAG: ABC transporter permease [Candidatus Bathyarchaeia archaeon]